MFMMVDVYDRPLVMMMMMMMMIMGLKSLK